MLYNLHGRLIFVPMITTYSDFRLKLKGYLDLVFQSRTPLHVTRTKGENIVVLSEADYESLMETFYLLKSPKNAKRLLRAVEQYEAGKGQERQLIEP
jgi:antitoxin YefM